MKITGMSNQRDSTGKRTPATKTAVSRQPYFNVNHTALNPSKGTAIKNPNRCPARATGGLVLALALLIPACLRAELDDFNDGDDVGWLKYDPIGSQLGLAQNTWSFPSGSYRMQAAPTPNPAAGPGRVGSLRQDVSYSNFHLEVDLLNWNPDRTNALGLIGRVQPNPGFGALSGYIFGYVSGDNYLALVRLDGERTRTIAGSLPFPIILTPGHGYRLTLTGKGTQLVGRLYDANDSNHPLAEVPASDSTYAEGTAGLVAFGVNGGVLSPVDVTFDNYAATDRARPRLQVELSPFTFNEMHVRWPQFEGEGYTLQRASSPIFDAIWTDVTNEMIPDGENFLHNAGMPAGNVFFRLRKTAAP